MTKRELSQLYYLKKEIKELKRRIFELEAAAASCHTQITGLPHESEILDKTGVYAVQLAELKTQLELNLKRCFDELKRLEAYIRSVEDSQMRTILTLRYIRGLSWQKIAYEIGEYDEQYPRRKHSAFLKKNSRETFSPEAVIL